MEFKKFFKMGGFVGIAIFLLILALTNCYTVDTGEVAIISTFGKITKVENEGLHVNQAYATAVILLILVIAINALSSFIAKKITKAQ